MSWVLKNHRYKEKGGVFRIVETPLAPWIVEQANELNATFYHVIKETNEFADVAFYTPDEKEDGEDE